MTKPVVEPFAAYRALGRGVPVLQSWTHRKTMTVEWYDGSMRDYSRFASAVDTDTMLTALLAVWERYRPQYDHRTRFSYGDYSGLMNYVPIEAGMEVVAIVREHYMKPWRP
jgi:hypothetical protein